MRFGPLFMAMVVVGGGLGLLRVRGKETTP